MDDHRVILRALEHQNMMLHTICGQQADVLNRLTSLEYQIMGLKEDMDANFAKLDTECTAIGELITKLTGGIHNSMSDAEVADVKAKFGILSDRLTSLAADPTNPVPPPPPQLETLKKQHP